MSAASPIKRITSRENPIVKSIATLAKSASARRAGGLCLLEGEHLANSYVERSGELETLVIRDDGAAYERRVESLRPLVSRAKQAIALSANVFDALSSLSTPTGVLAIASVPASPSLATSGFVLALDVVQDPGNVGTLIRTAAAAGASQVWLSHDSTFAWSTKTLRASQGAHFHIDVIEGVDLVSALTSFRGERWATLPRVLPGMDASVRALPLADTKFGSNVALIVSNEGAGLSKHLYSAVTHGVSIPMARGIESLNVASAGAIVLYAIAR